MEISYVKFNDINNIRVSEVVTIDRIKQWKAGDHITIKAGTGAGKSYFIKNILYAQAKRDNRKILMLIHRKNCVTQFKKELIRDKKTDVIDIMTYQKLENLFFKSPEDISLWQYQYIVCDEFHYFMGDAAFSKTTDISLDLILEQISSIKIFMSATGDYTKQYLNEIKGIRTSSYELPINYNFIKDLTFFKTDETLEDIIEEAIENNYKMILFIQSAKKAYELYEKHKDHCLFNCSKTNTTYSKFVNQEKIDNLLANEKFDELILITTCCMDTGVNIIDLDLNHIVCDVEDTGTLIQCIGRKRVQNISDKIYLYIKVINNKSLGGKKSKLAQKIKMAEFLKEHTVKEFISKYPREYDYSNIVYDAIVKEEDKGTKKVNDLMFYKCKIDIYEIEQIFKVGYCNYIKELLGNDQYLIIENELKIINLRVI
ncbi:helicase-related protein [Desulfosporosinus nitroreducens]|uniref:DNA helicase n=1 Tax=Desulfosporosinus nitroreducens TaxID=2018668 RepID=A0ABT8QP15_9FIRM|nr:helicase-related protein [Desulfosporosinus nitroreducens]MDO0823086.1 DNA helicase [Desulfosporosinus nitroreducens]